VRVSESCDHTESRPSSSARKSIESSLVFPGTQKAADREDALTQALAALMFQLARLSREALYSAWISSLWFSASRSRKSLLADIRAFTPVISAMGDVDNLVVEYTAIEEAGRWWS
jgi:hypothetical protein